MQFNRLWSRVIRIVNLMYSGINRQYSYGDVSDSPIKPRYQREGTNPPYASTGAMNYQVTSNKLVTREDGDGESTLPV